VSPGRVVPGEELQLRTVRAAGAIFVQKVVRPALEAPTPLERLVAEAGEPDPAQLTFEIIAFLEAANAASVLHDDASAYGKARAALRARISPRP
jgi:hypothetical protein